ncbi:lipase/acyltransferase domain-containing protein [Paenibacillus eucommiae]|uniref:Pimeloyl-ACP methyl ester carboxylesterase n=1 Tax=Paenibacillus eucommiae TaxID=1355755 RepID=A0ABS4J4D0_9BACL|nr:hypothetical protein [Paenibacillus eucommiae]MBP1994699.1 pimeloyl-ACP methyl ester carboxylesterase [Paenibacillus eucommiae]
MKRVLSALLLSMSLLVQTALPSALALPGGQSSNAISYQEQEPNNTPEDNQRYSLAGGENFVFTGDVSGRGYLDDPVDYYPFQVTKSGYMSVLLQETATANLTQVAILDDSGNEIEDDNPNPLYEKDDVWLEEGNQYYVQVSVREDMVGSGFHYRLQVGFHVQQTPIDAYEPNNNKESAASTTLGASPSAKLEGVIGSADDQDWYRFETAETGFFNLNLHNIPEGTGYDFKLFNSYGDLISSTENRPGKIMHNVYGSRGQTFYVQVYSSAGYDLNDTYVLERTFTSSYDVSSGDIHEWNNNLETATVTTLGQSTSDVGTGTIHVPEDQDWYAVKLSQTGNFQVGLVLAPSQEYHIALYEANGDSLYSTEYYEEHEPKQLPLHFGAQGDVFYVKVFTEAGNAAPYEDYEFEVTQIGGDIYEPNNTSDRYTSTTLGDSNAEYLSATLHGASDVDWYLVSPYTPGYFEIIMNQAPVDGYQMELYDENMQLIAAQTTFNGKPMIEEVFGKKGVRYYLKVFSASGASSNSPYELLMNVDHIGLWANEGESNDSFDQANGIARGVDILGTISSSTDRDYYRYISSDAGKLHFSLEVPSAFHNYNIQVFDEAKKLVAESSMPGNATDYALDLPVLNSTYYVMVYPAVGAKTGTDATYRLKAMSHATPVDTNEPNDTTEKATGLKVASYAQNLKGTIHSANDVDYYKVSNEVLPYDLKLELTDIPAGTNYDVKVIDKDGNTVASSKNAGNKAESFSVVIPKNKTYYIGVYTADGKFDMNASYKLTFKNNGSVPIIIVPGFGGTALYGNDPMTGLPVNAWMNFAVTSTASLMYQDLYNDATEAKIGLHYKDRDYGLWDISDVAPEDMMFGQDMYFTEMISDLKTEGYVPGRTLFGLPNNFIRDNTEASDALKQRIDLAIEKSGSSKVMLISHSNGGLIVKEAAMDSNYASKVSKWITLGTPFLGAPTSLKAWIDGYDLDIPILSSAVGRKLAMHSPTAHGLIPSPSYHHLYGPVLQYFKKRSEARNDHEIISIDSYQKMADFLSNVNEGQVEPYLNFREDLLDRVLKKHQTIYDLPQTDIPLYIISGYGMDTISSYTYVKPVNDVREYASNGSPVAPLYVSGDGTVPEFSSKGTLTFPVGTKNTRVYGVTGVNHMPLVTDQRNRKQVKQVMIYGNEEPVAGIRLESDYRNGKHTNYLATTGMKSTLSKGPTSTVYSIPLTGQESKVTLTLKNGEKTVIRINADKTYLAEQQANHMTINNLGDALWITTPVDQGTTVSWTGASLTGTKVYDLQNGAYKTSYEVRVSGTLRSFTVSNSVAQPNRLKGVSVQEMPVFDTGISDQPTEAYE